MPKFIAYKHDNYLKKFEKDKSKFTTWIKKTYGLTKNNYIINIMTFIKLTTTFDTGNSVFSYVAYAKAKES